MEHEKEDLIVIGGGIGGLAIALGATEANKQVKVLNIKRNKI